MKLKRIFNYEKRWRFIERNFTSNFRNTENLFPFVFAEANNGAKAVQLVLLESQQHLVNLAGDNIPFPNSN